MFTAKTRDQEKKKKHNITSEWREAGCLFECSPYKQEGLSLNPQHPHKKPRHVALKAVINILYIISTMNSFLTYWLQMKFDVEDHNIKQPEMSQLWGLAANHSSGPSSLS